MTNKKDEDLDIIRKEYSETFKDYNKLDFFGKRMIEKSIVFFKEQGKAEAKKEIEEKINKRIVFFSDIIEDNTKFYSEEEVNKSEDIIDELQELEKELIGENRWKEKQ